MGTSSGPLSYIAREEVFPIVGNFADGLKAVPFKTRNQSFPT